MKKLFIKTFGCQMNDRDSQLVSGLFVKRGWKPVESFDKADVILFNTCSVREHAEARVWGNIGMLRKLKNKRPEIVIGVIGCMAQRVGKDFFNRSDLVDIVCGPSDEEKLPDLVEEFVKTRKHILSVSNFGKPRKEMALDYASKYVLIAHGCNNFCSYCIVPHVRGKEISRKPQDIIREIKMLAANGVKEITLLGQNVNSYLAKNGDSPKKTGQSPFFVKLLEQINNINGIEKIKFMTSHPKDAR